MTRIATAGGISRFIEHLQRIALRSMPEGVFFSLRIQNRVYFAVRLHCPLMWEGLTPLAGGDVTVCPDDVLHAVEEALHVGVLRTPVGASAGPCTPSPEQRVVGMPVLPGVRAVSVHHVDGSRRLLKRCLGYGAVYRDTIVCLLSFQKVTNHGFTPWLTMYDPTPFSMYEK